MTAANLPSGKSEPLSLPQAAAYAGRSTDTIRRWIRSGYLPARRSGPYSNSHLIVDQSDLDRLMRPIPTVDAPEVSFNADTLGATLARIEARLQHLEAKLVRRVA